MGSMCSSQSAAEPPGGSGDNSKGRNGRSSSKRGGGAHKKGARRKSTKAAPPNSKRNESFSSPLAPPQRSDADSSRLSAPQSPRHASMVSSHSRGSDTSAGKVQLRREASITTIAVKPDRRASAVTKVQSAADRKALHDAETKARATIESNAMRLFQMYSSDLQATMPKEVVVAVRPIGPSGDRGGEFSDDDEGPRRCSMRTEEHQAVAHVGNLHRQRAAASSPSVGPASKNPYSRASVRRHNTEDDLWVIVRGKIYDVTSFIDEHPGGSWMIAKNGGQDATAEFESAHDRSIWKQLGRFFVADVAD